MNCLNSEQKGRFILSGNDPMVSDSFFRYFSGDVINAESQEYHASAVINMVMSCKVVANSFFVKSLHPAYNTHGIPGTPQGGVSQHRRNDGGALLERSAQVWQAGTGPDGTDPAHQGRRTHERPGDQGHVL